MIICIGSEGNNLENQIAKRFGHAEFYMLYNTESKTVEAIKNEEVEKHDHEILNNFIDKGAKTFIVGNIGPHAFEILKSGGSKVYLARKMKVLEAITSFNNGELKELVEPTAKKSINHGKHERGDEHKRHSNQ